MRQKYEIMEFTQSVPVRCTMRHADTSGIHLHNFFEIDLILGGKCKVSVADQSYSLSTDDIIAINPHTPHDFSGSEFVYLSVQFDQTLFERTLPEPRHPDFLCNSAIQGNSAAFDDLRNILAKLAKNGADRHQGYELRNLSFVYELMDVMYNNFRVHESFAQTQRASRYIQRIEQISAIINDNYQSNLTLNDLANAVHLSAPYLSKFFDSHFGVSFLAYLTQVRLNHAIKDLQLTDHTIETISADSGFPNSHSFVQAFKREYGILPSAYRRQFSARESSPPPITQIEQHNYMAGLKKYLERGETNPPTIPAIGCNILCDASASAATLTHNWKNMLSITKASALLSSDIQDMIRRVQKDIGFRYVKFNGIFSDDMFVYDEDGNGEPVFSFSNVDKALDFLQSVHLAPLIQLSFVPRKLAKTSKYLFNYLISEPSDLSKWNRMVDAFFRHILKRYGRNTIRQWLFCLWEQPDTPQSLYGFPSNKSFYSFYQSTYSIIKSLDPHIRFGSPATFYIMDSGFTNWYLPFLDWCREQGCVPDFLNFHYYDTILTSESDSGKEAFGFAMAMSLRNTPDSFSDFVTQVRSERAACKAQDLPIYLTEWNNTPSQQDLLNDTCFKSCYIAKGILENYDKLDSYAYWSLTDWMNEAVQPEDLFYGGLGMFTVNGIPKPSYYMFTLLNRLGDTLLGKGKGWFATRRGDSYAILVYNYRHFSHLYALGERFDMTFTDRYTPFTPEQAMDVHLHLTNIPDGTYLVKETVLGRESGSAFDLWVSMGATELSSQDELDALTRLSVPSFTKYTATAAQNVLELNAMLSMLDVRLLEISPID